MWIIRFMSSASFPLVVIPLYHRGHHHCKKNPFAENALVGMAPKKACRERQAFGYSSTAGSGSLTRPATSDTGREKAMPWAFLFMPICL